MKPKEKIEILNKVADECDPEHEALFSIYATHKKGGYFAVGDMSLVRGGIYEILNNGTAGEEETLKPYWLGVFLVLFVTCETEALTSMRYWMLSMKTERR